MMEEKSLTPVFTITKNGPIRVTGNFVLKADNNEVIESKEDIFLCRCGKSSKQPFCDGSHKESCS